MNNPRHYHRRALLGYAVAAAAAIAAPIIIGGAAGAYKAAQSTPGGVKEKGKAAAVGFATGAMGAGSNIAESFK